MVRVVPSGRTVRQAWEEGNVHSRRDLLAANYAGIIVQPDRLIMITQPTHAVDENAVEEFRRGAIAADE